MDKDKYFFCYNLSLGRFLKDEMGIKYITHAVHPKTKNAFFLFEYTDELRVAIARYKRLRDYFNKKVT
ncbi:hypothetical protein [Halobacillus litoralis]|uniref:hypothetical protein n=1 Tax=Halobacillus litoralis TaxID=45668 RepID=UPI001CD79BB9|nr:hypothetical protein [Halobacillus litoralis]MCA1021616.1 hypothetical protein [Halobacillus litoralis]